MYFEKLIASIRYVPDAPCDNESHCKKRDDPVGASDILSLQMPDCYRHGDDRHRG